MHSLVPSSSSVSDSVTEPIISRIPTLDARTGLDVASSLLLDNKLRLLAATNGGLETTRGLFNRALGEEQAGKWQYFSCDEDKVAKPAPSVYAQIKKRLGVEDGKEPGWFVASHTWCVDEATLFSLLSFVADVSRCVSTGTCSRRRRLGTSCLQLSHSSAPRPVSPLGLADNLLDGAC